MTKRVRSYGKIVTETPVRAVWRDGVFEPADPGGPSDGRVVAILPCEDAMLRSIYATWDVEMDQPDPVPPEAPVVDQALTVAVDLRVGVQCGLTVSRSS